MKPTPTTKPASRWLKTSLLAASLALAGAPLASAHTTYSGRDFGTFGDDGFKSVNITASNLSSNFGWADGTDADFGDAHRVRAFRFKLTHAAIVTFRVQGAGATPVPFPAFSLYAGLLHSAPEGADYDTAAITVNHLATTGDPQPKEGAFRAFNDWKIGNDPTYNTPGDTGSGILYPAELSELTYLLHKADGTSTNFGSAAGIEGDGTADGDVQSTFPLPAGDYTLIVGGADYAASVGAVGTPPNFGFSATLTANPFPIVKGGECEAVAGSIYHALYPPAVNGAAILAFRADLKTGTAVSSFIGRRTTSVAAVAQSGTAAADTTAMFKAFGDPVLNDDGEVAFTATLKTGVRAGNDSGVWSDLGGTLHLALREGEQAPGLPTGKLFAKASWINLQDGALYIGATTSRKGSGVWKWDGAALTKVVALGDAVLLTDGVTHTVKTIMAPASTGNGNATSRLVGSDGTLTLLIRFTDGRVETVTFR